MSISSPAYAGTKISKDKPILFKELPKDTVIMYIGGKEVTIADLGHDNSITIDGVKYHFKPNEVIDKSKLKNDESINEFSSIDNKSTGTTPNLSIIEPGGGRTPVLQRVLMELLQVLLYGLLMLLIYNVKMTELHRSIYIIRFFINSIIKCKTYVIYILLRRK